MARTIPQTKPLNFLDRELFRAIYYHQQLPHNLLALGTSALSSRIQVLKMAGYLTNASGQLELTDTGKLAMQRMYGGQKPPMINTWYEAHLDPKNRKSQFVVGSSIASKLAREVSSGE